MVTKRLKSSGNEPQRETSSDIQEGLAVPSLLLQESAEAVWVSDQDEVRCSGKVLKGADPGYS